MDADVSYLWMGDFGLLAEVVVAVNYKEEMGQVYVQLSQSETYDSKITKDAPMHECKMMVHSMKKPERTGMFEREQFEE